ncbi:hypothetical protein [Halobacterium wangiae]|uniref:hypothetical protein n=1 Tax=Halobacterium wangiae TaxID=2902623 RepID=UPI001E5F3B35|nr:hypothetical protein [Halobacterium wangiae]
MSRRRFLATSATVATLVLAGCGDPGDGDDGGGDGGGGGGGYDVDEPQPLGPRE